MAAPVTLSVSVVAIARALIKSRGLAPDIAQRVAEKVAARLASTRAPEAPVTLSADDELMAGQISRKRGIPLEEARSWLASQSAPPQMPTKLSAAAIAGVLRARGVPLDLAGERAEQIAGTRAALRAVGERPTAPATPADGVRITAAQLYKSNEGRLSFEECQRIIDARSRKGKASK
jgi:hypothetical protein